MYDNIMEFETDLAQIVELIILFCESEGSLAELGAFAMIAEIASRLFVVVREDHWNERSFIKLGPLRLIETRYGRESLFVLDDGSVGITSGKISSVKKDQLKDTLIPPIQTRLERPHEPTTFDKTRPGHVIKLLVGLVQEYAALRFDEIADTCKLFGVDCTEQELRGYLLCGIALNWVKKISKGSHDYFVTTGSGIDAAVFHVKADATVRNKARRRLLIREHWKQHDQARHRAISQMFGGLVGV